MDIKKFLLDNAIAPKKSWDQFFLHNDSVIEKEISLADLKSSDVVLEVGAGFGNLTERLAEKASVIAIEKDRKFIPYLRNIKNVRAVYGNAVRVLEDRSLKFNKIVSNIPYSFSKKIILGVLKHRWETAVLIVQKEFAEKLLGGSKLGLLTQDCCDLKIVQDTPGADFYPPALQSSMILLKQKKKMNEKFWMFLNEIFRQNNKNVSNVVKNCPKHLAGKKVRQLTLKDVRKLYKTSL